ncbi:MAG: OsmC family protein [Myxococcaceae bacterium]|nr:OsmC family protein [Myxococcaceae bacterium]
MSTPTTSLNDVNLTAVAALASHIQQRPQAANTTWKADVEWTGAFTSKARIRGFAPIASDEPATLGGSDTAPNPVEQLLAALGNCLAVGYAANASAQGIAIRSLSLSLEGNLDLHTFLGLAQGNAGYENVKVTVHLDADATPEQLEALHRKVVGTSPVGHTLQRAVPVSIELARPKN